MPLERLEWDEWIGRVSKDHQIRNPTWEQVQAAIERLDQHRYSIASLIANENAGLMIGGGNGCFVITAFLTEDQHLTATHEAGPPVKTPLAIGGQTGFYDEKIIFGLEESVKCAWRFWDDHSLDSSMVWK